MSIKKIIGMLLTVLSIIMIFWVAASYIDITCHNLDNEPIYQTWNFFQLLIEHL